MQKECSEDKKNKLLEMAKLAETIGERALERDVRERLRKLEKQAPAVASEVAVGMRTARIQRDHEATAKRDRAAQEDREDKNLKQRIKIVDLERRRAYAEANSKSSEVKKMES